ncbi:SMP-30/gluconolactonase/LRE family protein [Aureibacillus halotolerans]|uniref:Sugar lactone lactonase YvrE n=1 Tax=Aureibacillus halotolerans TaxID=1508390 RepID=A0A4R6U8H0_9BACI|nr:SMP-30/gluconolactonase/LRE family protein [Aureibacillus halotolerans]TDQ41079.1 sugar lactone lactonase YvrE [Aureibacillus halotolerans]
MELLVDAKAQLGEGPSWFANENKLYWVDIIGKKVHQYDPKTGKDEQIQVSHMVGTLAPVASGGLIIAMQNGIHLLDWETGGVTPVIDPEQDLPDNRFNDGKCDPAGRLWAGTMHLHGQKEAGALYCLDTDGTVMKKRSQVSTSNGLAWSPDGTKMYYIDTPTQQVVEFSYDQATGDISNEEVIITVPRGAGSPDGMTIDQEGMLWIAHWGGSGISRWDPNQKKQLDFIDVPALNVTSCAFGGDQLSDLYITTARVGTSDEQLEKYPHAGGVFLLQTNVKGSPTFSYQG